jgi:hypothetical protein
MIVALLLIIGFAATNANPAELRIEVEVNNGVISKPKVNDGKDEIIKMLCEVCELACFLDSKPEDNATEIFEPRQTAKDPAIIIMLLCKVCHKACPKSELSQIFY